MLKRFNLGLFVLIILIYILCKSTIKDPIERSSLGSPRSKPWCKYNMCGELNIRHPIEFNQSNWSNKVKIGRRLPMHEQRS